MFTPSIILSMIMNTIAASGAVFVALQASALETGDRPASTALAAQAAKIPAAGFSQQEGTIPGTESGRPIAA
jgi:hypothetical protein